MLRLELVLWCHQLCLQPAGIAVALGARNGHQWGTAGWADVGVSGEGYTHAASFAIVAMMMYAPVEATPNQNPAHSP